MNNIYYVSASDGSLWNKNCSSTHALAAFLEPSIIELEQSNYSFTRALTLVACYPLSIYYYRIAKFQGRWINSSYYYACIVIVSR